MHMPAQKRRARGRGLANRAADDAGRELPGTWRAEGGQAVPELWAGSGGQAVIVSELSRQELQRVTGKVQGAAQMRFFERLGLRPIPHPDGHPIVTWEALTAYQLGKAGNDEWQPDFTRYRKAG